MPSMTTPEDEQRLRRKAARRLRSSGPSSGFLASLHPRVIQRLLFRTIAEWSRKNLPRLSAALAFYTIFTLTPMLLVLLSIAGLLYGDQAARGQVSSQLEGLMGSTGGEVVERVLRSVQEPARSVPATVLSVLTLFFGASLAVAELRNALNVIWGVPTPEEEQGLVSDVLSLIRKRFFAFLMVIAIGLLLLISVTASTLLSAAGKYFSAWLPWPELVLQLLDFLTGLVVTTPLFMFIYKVLPDVKIAWRDVLVGAAVTAVLFTAGKLLISLYLGKSGVGSPYGAAGSLVLLLVWIYYSAQVFLFGAEFTEVYATRHGSRPRIRRRRWAR